MVSCDTCSPRSLDRSALSQPAICSATSWPPAFSQRRRRSGRCIANLQGFGRGPLPTLACQLLRPDSDPARLAADLAADRRGRPTQPPGQRAGALADRQAPRDLLALGETQLLGRALPGARPQAPRPVDVPGDRALVTAQRGADLDGGLPGLPTRPQRFHVLRRQPPVLTSHDTSGECRNLPVALTD